MKKLLLAATVAAMGVSAAQAAPTLYGKINLSVDQIENISFIEDQDKSELNSNASRIGVKGEEKLTDNVSAVYVAEWEISADGDESDAQTFKKRNLFGGLKFANVGTLKAGIFDSYFKNAAGKYQDIFNDHTLDITNMMYGEDRLKNSIGFETDKKMLGGLQFNILAQQGEDATKEDYATTGQKGKRDGFGDSISTSLTYENKDVGVALALAGNFGVEGKYNGIGAVSELIKAEVVDAVGIKLPSTKLYSDAIRVTGSYDFSKIGANGLVLGALYQQAEPTDDIKGFEGLEEKAWLISSTYKVGNTPWVVKAQYQTAETTADIFNGDITIDQYGIGVDYNLNKQTRLYGLLAQQKLDITGVDLEEDNKTVFGLGMEYNF